jgi:SPP1 gp7 family putative phage head morphogenesis protein
MKISCGKCKQISEGIFTEKIDIIKCKLCEGLNRIDRDISINEWLGFRYSDYIKQILSNLKEYDFNQIKAITDAEVTAGYLSEQQVNELKGILENGFKKGYSMKQMAKEIDSKLQLKDLYRMTETGELKKGASGLPILQKTKENRSIGIVRSEVTRLANMGAVDYYKENGISKVRWVSSFGDRTCPDCESLNGEIFDIGSEEEMPLHPMCRCTYTPVVEVK